MFGEAGARLLFSMDGHNGEGRTLPIPGFQKTPSQRGAFILVFCAFFFFFFWMTPNISPLSFGNFSPAAKAQIKRRKFSRHIASDPTC